MVQLIHPNKVSVITRNGECNINITLDLNLNLDAGGLELAQGTVKKAKQVEEEEEDKVNWAIPDFESTGKVQFGKKD